MSKLLRLALASLLVPVACSTKSETPPTPTPTNVTATSFSPNGCAYKVEHIAEFPDFVASSDASGSAATPSHVRIGLGGGVDSSKPGYADPSTSFAVGWQTDVDTKFSKIRVGEAPDKLTTANDGISYVVPREFGKGPIDGIRFHEAHVCGLTPGRTYYYQVGGGDAWSPVAQIATAPAKGSKDPLIVALVGDSRDTDGTTDLPVWRALAGRVKTSGARLALFSGDNVASGVDQSLWDKWLAGSDDTAKQMFFATAPGNHENELIRYFAHAVMPGVGKNSERYASFDYGPVHVMMIDDYIGVVAPSIDVDGYKTELLAWIDADLARADGNRANVPWIVVFHHHPVFDSGTADRVKEREATHAAFAARWDEYHVDLDVAGHDHFYERSKPIVADAVATKGTTYVVCAGAGAPSYSTVPDNPLSQKIEHYDPAVLEGLY